MIKIELQGLLGERYRKTWQNNVLQLPWEDEFLAPFAAPHDTGKSYIGMGKSLEAVSRFAAQTEDPALLKLRNELILRMASVQEPETGYIGLFPAAKRVKELWDLHEQAYLVLGLIADWHLFKDPQTFEIVTHLGKYLKGALQSEAFEGIEFESGGTAVHRALGLIALDLALIELSRLTGDANYLELARVTLGLDDWDLEIVEGRFPPLHGHAYAYLARCLALMELAKESSSEPSFSKPVERVLKHLFTERALLVTGTCGIKECWCSDHTCTGDVGETCATTYLMRLMAHLHDNDGNPFWLDLFERSLFNAFLAAQSPDARKIRYYTAHEGERVYFDRDTYCCPGNFRRMMAALPDFLFHADESGLDIRIPTPARIQVPFSHGEPLVLSINGNYPKELHGEVRIEAAPKRPVRIRLRIPGWAQNPIVSSDTSAELAESGKTATFETIWQPGDTIRFDFADEGRWVGGIKSQAGKTAFVKGCLVYGTESELPNQNSPLKPFYDPDVRSIYRPALSASHITKDFIWQVPAGSPRSQRNNE